MPKAVVLGEALIDLFADSGVTLQSAETLYPRPGGAPANVAVGLARLGVDVGFVGKVGADDYGRYLIDLLAGEGVDTIHFTADPQAPTMLAIVAAPTPTDQQFILYNGANARLSAAEISQGYIASAALFIYSSITLSTGSRAAAMQAVKWARDANRLVIFDVNLRPILWSDMDEARQQIERSIASASVVKLNETELAFVTGSVDPMTGARILIDRGVQLCCVSLGADGAYYDNGSARGHVPAMAVDVRDTTGSGDAFVAGLVMQLSQLKRPLPALEGADLGHIIGFANACGALAATQLGAMSALPTLAAVTACTDS